MSFTKHSGLTHILSFAKHFRKANGKCNLIRAKRRKNPTKQTTMMKINGVEESKERWCCNDRAINSNQNTIYSDVSITIRAESTRCKSITLRIVVTKAQRVNKAIAGEFPFSQKMQHWRKRI